MWLRPEGGTVEHVAQRRLQDPFPLSLIEQGRHGRKDKDRSQKPRTHGAIRENQNQQAKHQADPGKGAWFFKLKIADKSELTGLMDEAAYKAHTA